jgi:hypothetical protein
MKLWMIQKPIVPTVLLSVQAALCARADTDAITFPPSPISQVVGYYNGVLGWSFVPTTNLLVTWVGYKNVYGPTSGVAGLTITFWSSTNTPMTSYLSDNLTASRERDSNRVIYAKIDPFLLLAQNQYYISSDLGSDAQAVEMFTSDFSRTDMPFFQAASELMYQGAYTYDAGNGFLKPWIPVMLFLGPTFRYQLAFQAVPRLSIERVGNSVVLAWPTNALDCVVETSTCIATSSWEELSNAPPPSVTGGRYVYTYYPPDDQPRFFRLRLR